MAVDKKKSTKAKTTKHTALISKRLGSNADGTAKVIINAGDTLNLTKEQVTNYRAEKIIK